MTRDIEVVDRLAAVTNRFDQYTLCNAVQSLTRQALAEGFDPEDIKAVLSFMMETEVDVTVDVWETEPDFDSAGFSIADRFEDEEEVSHHCDDPGCKCTI